MELTSEFVVPVGIDEAWALLTDVERIAPCMPGAELQEIDGDDYRGVVKVKVGPITAQYKGQATFIKKDEDAHIAVLDASGRDVKGQGNAKATITATLVSEGKGTKVSVVTDLAITGRVAQFGRGVMADVSSKLLGQFVTCLEQNVLNPPAEAVPEPVPAAAPVATAAPAATVTEAPAGPRKVSAPAYSAEPVNLLDAAGASVFKRLLLPVVGVMLVLVAGRSLRRCRRG